MIQEILKTALAELETIKNKVPTDVYNASFESALEGIEKGYADYKKDAVLDKIKSKIEERVKKIQNLSPEELKKIIELTKEQFNHLRTLDDNAREEYLSKVP